MDRLLMRLARLIPWKLRYWVVINAWADATQGRWSHVEAPGVTVHEALERMR